MGLSFLPVAHLALQGVAIPLTGGLGRFKTGRTGLPTAVGLEFIASIGQSAAIVPKA
jgi:hypothetical protein